MKFAEISVKTNSQSAEIVAYFLQEISADGVSIYDKNDLYDNPSWDYKDDNAEAYYGDEVVVKGYCNLGDEAKVTEYLQGCFASLKDAGSLQISVTVVDGNGWVDKWKETFRPIETDKIVIVPEWQSFETDKAKLLLDVGVAFGTGQHETTSMCLKFAETLDLHGKRVLDVGCGSGILGLSALLLGASYAELVDIDSQATDAAAHNAAINGLSDKCAIKTGNLVEQTKGVFDVIFANLTADILNILRKDIASVTRAETTVVLSGILDVKLQQVLDVYGDYFDTAEVKSQGEWRAVLLRVKAR